MERLSLSRQRLPTLDLSMRKSPAVELGWGCSCLVRLVVGVEKWGWDPEEGEAEEGLDREEGEEEGVLRRVRLRRRVHPREG